MIAFQIALMLALRFPKTTLVLCGITFAGMYHASTAAGGGPVPTFSTEMTPASWADALLAELAMPDTAENVDAVMAWETAEGGHWRNAAAYNPLNTTQQVAGSWAINTAGCLPIEALEPGHRCGVQAYPSWDAGMQATVATLRNGLYGGILAALKRGDCAPCVANAVASSPWGTGRFAV